VALAASLMSDDRALACDDLLVQPVRRQDLLRQLELAAAPSQPSAAGAPARLPRPRRPKRSSRHPAGRPLSILVAEDNAVNQRVIEHQLERMGCEARIVANGLQAVEAAATGQYDLILMDCQMPELDGLGATRRLRELAAKPDTRLQLPVHHRGDGQRRRQGGAAREPLHQRAWTTTSPSPCARRS
jgi:CheY-like chemotaxis protein